MNIQIFLSCLDSYESSDIDEFQKELKGRGIEVISESRNNEVHACNEWFMPTAIVAGVGGAFIAEIGKDLYGEVKKYLSDLTQKTMAKPRIEPIFIGTLGKTDKNNPFTNAFSIYSETKSNARFKLLIPKYSHDINYGEIIYGYLDFLKDYNDGLISESDIGLLDQSKIKSNVLLVQFNTETKVIEWVDPSKGLK